MCPQKSVYEIKCIKQAMSSVVLLCSSQTTHQSHSSAFWLQNGLNRDQHMVLLPFQQSLWGGDTSQHMPRAASVLFCHPIDHKTHSLITYVTESTMKRLGQCPPRLTWASEEGPRFICSLFSFHLAKRLDAHVFIHEDGEILCWIPVSPHQQCCCFVGLFLIYQPSYNRPLS